MVGANHDAEDVAAAGVAVVAVDVVAAAADAVVTDVVAVDAKLHAVAWEECSA